MSEKFLKYFGLVKVDEAQRIVYGLVTAEREDKDGETCEYTSTKPQYEKVNAEMSKATDGANIMPLREMHQLHAVGAGKSIEFDDSKKEIRMAFKVVEDSTWKKVMEKVLTGFSQGGRYIKKWKADGKTYYTAEPGEVSLVDNPCLAGAVIEYAKADGTVESFKVPETSLVRLSDSDIERLSKSLVDSILNTGAKDLDAALAERMRQRNAEKGETMNPEQIKKCAAALGITEEEFTKQFIEGPLAKAHSMAALHGHIEKAAVHHEEMMAHHEKMGKMHTAHAAALGKCMKACKSLMGSDDEAEKAFKALKDELAEMAKAVKEPEVKTETGITPEQMTKAIADAVTAATTELQKKFDEKLEKTLAPNNGGTGARLQLVDRDGKVLTKAASASEAQDPMAV